LDIEFGSSGVAVGCGGLCLNQPNNNGTFANDLAKQAKASSLRGAQRRIYGTRSAN
jgi:hypothetical protein